MECRYLMHLIYKRANGFASEICAPSVVTGVGK